MPQIAFHVIVSASALGLLLLLSTVIFPQLGRDSLHSFDHSLPKSPPLTSAGDALEHDGGNSESHGHPWMFDHTTDSNNHGLTEEQCLTAFPDLYKEIDRAVEYRHKRGDIAIDELDLEWRHGGIVRILVRDNHVYVVDTLDVERGHRFRYLATLNSLQLAVSAAQDKLPNIEFTYAVHDFALGHGKEMENRNIVAYSRDPEQESVWLMPDFGFWGWPKVGMPSYSDHRLRIEDREVEFSEKIPKLIWRGGLHQGEDVRQALINESEGQSWSDVHALAWNNQTDIDENLMSMAEHCDYMFAAMTEGFTWSGRLKFLLNCANVVVSHELRYLEFYTHLLSSSGESQNYVKLADREFSNLRSTMEHLLEPENLEAETRRIADNARRTFREQYLTPAAVSCYWRQFIRGWASVQGFEPQLWTEEENGRVRQDGKKSRIPRGTPIESYVIMEATEWEVPADPRQLIILDRDG